MKFKKEITITIEGEIFDKQISPEDLFKNLKFSWKHWWQSDPNWIYGTPTEKSQKGRIDKVLFEEKEINNAWKILE